MISSRTIPDRSTIEHMADRYEDSPLCAADKHGGTTTQTGIDTGIRDRTGKIFNTWQRTRLFATFGDESTTK